MESPPPKKMTRLFANYLRVVIPDGIFYLLFIIFFYLRLFLPGDPRFVQPLKIRPSYCHARFMRDENIYRHALFSITFPPPPTPPRETNPIQKGAYDKVV